MGDYLLPVTAGTISITNNSRVVIGSGTAFLTDSVMPGDLLQIGLSVFPLGASLSPNPITESSFELIDLFTGYVNASGVFVAGTASAVAYKIHRFGPGHADATNLSTRLAEIFRAVQTGFSMTSGTALELSAGSKVAVVPSGMPILPGAPLNFASRANPDTHRMTGIVTDYDGGTSLTLSVASGGFFGSGTRNDWNINITGAAGDVTSELQALVDEAEGYKDDAETAASAASASASSASGFATTASGHASTASAAASAASGSASAASDSAAAALTSENNAETAETNAETAETNAEAAQAAAEAAQSAAEGARDAALTAETNAETAETNAETAASNAATSESNAATSAGTATTQAGIATTQAGIATGAAAAAAASFDSFDDIYLGSKTSDPTLDNDGDPLVEGQLYWNSVANNLRVYDGAAWQVYSAASGLTAVIDDTNPALGGDLDLNGSDITGTGDVNITGSITATTINQGADNVLDVGDVGTLVQAYAAALAALAALSTTDGNFIVGNGSTWVAESGATARTSLGVGTGDSPEFAGINVGHASDTTITRVSAGVIAVEGVPLFSNIPQNSKSAAYTLVLADAQKHIFHPSADTTARIWTIPANASVAFPIGTAVTFVNQNAGGVITIAITTDTMRLAGAGTTGSRALAADGIATALKITSTEWIISGTGLT